MSTIAYITTSQSMPDVDPGLSIHQDGSRVREADVDLVQGDDFDRDHADRLLAELGWQRAGEWQESGGQWAAEVEYA